MKGKNIGVLLLIIGFGAIAGGILMKRVFNMPGAVIPFHATGGLLLAIGASVYFLGKEEKS